MATPENRRGIVSRKAKSSHRRDFRADFRASTRHSQDAPGVLPGCLSDAFKVPRTRAPGASFRKMITGKRGGDTGDGFSGVYPVVRGLPKIQATKTETT